jgi:hypothetical protein
MQLTDHSTQQNSYFMRPVDKVHRVIQQNTMCIRFNLLNIILFEIVPLCINNSNYVHIFPGLP